MREKRSFTREFKESTITLVRDGGKTVMEVALELGICPENIRRWIRASDKAKDGKQKAFPGHGNPRDEELARLRKENKDLREANEILKKATAYFAANPLK